ncbi:type IV secretion system protein [Vibrio algicola]|uniref:type IV secretion system protein n=1 Tax=Vibrio algicola TaxID=2662262 RepID=UPI0015B3F03F|nr:type IV secretion system protein [Vibrio algicola]
MKLWMWGGVIFIASSSIAYATPSASIIARSGFDNTVTGFINNIMSTSNDVQWFCLALLTVLSVLALISEWAHFAMNGLDVERLIMCALFIIITTFLCTHFVEPMDVIWNSADQMSLGFLEGVTGNRDPLYLTIWLNRSLERIISKEPSILLDGLYPILMSMLWNLATILLQIVIYLVGVWATWGFLLSKLLGLIFIPCLAYGPTRPFFDAYVKFFLGFVILLITLRVTGALAALTINAQFQTLGLGCSTLIRCALTNAVSIDISSQSHMIVTCFICIFLVCSSFKISHKLAGSCGSASGGAMQGLGSLTKKALSKGLA